MAKAILKNSKTEGDAKKFLAGVEDEDKRKDCIAIVKMMQAATGDKPKMWGAAIIGFGDVYLKYDSGRELDWFKIGFAPRKQYIALYGLLNSSSVSLLKKLGKHKTGKGCLYINALEDVDAGVLQQLMKTAADKKGQLR